MNRRILDTFRDADGLPVTATFAAYMIEGGFGRYLDAQNSGGYDEWYSSRWDEFRARTGAQDVFATGEVRVRFLDWLDDRAVDQIARNAVERAA